MLFIQIAIVGLGSGLTVIGSMVTGLSLQHVLRQHGASIPDHLGVGAGCLVGVAMVALRAVT